jgi:hypothetical protein
VHALRIDAARGEIVTHLLRAPSAVPRSSA